MSFIRLASDRDAAAITEIYRPSVESTVISFETEAPDEVEMGRRIADTLPSHPWFVYVEAGRIAGYAYASRHRARAAYKWSVDTAVYVSSEFHRRGIGRALYRSLLAVLSAQGYFNAYAGITLPNPASVGLHESVGFRQLGVYRRVGYKGGAWHDVGWWELPLREHTAAPEALLSLATVAGRPDWNHLLATGLPMIKSQSART